MKKTTLIILLTFLGLSSNIKAQTDAVINEDSIKEAKLLALPEVKDVAKRVGDTLILTLQNGNIRYSFINQKIDGAIVNSFNIVKIIGNICVVNEYQEMGMALSIYKVINLNDGQFLNIQFLEPVFSPDNKRLLIKKGMDEPFNGITIVNLEIGIDSKEFDLNYNMPELSDVAWVSSTEIKFVYKGSPLKYKFNGTKWVLATAQPVKKPATAVKKPIKK